MTNAIETTKREMYESLEIIKEFSRKPLLCRYLENALENHLEQLRQQYEQMAAMASERFEAIQSLEQSGQDLTAKLSAMTEERDSMRNQLQALQMASQTAAEVIRGLRSELFESRECNATASELKSPVGANTDAYSMGFNNAGGVCPFAINTIERLHWMYGPQAAGPDRLIHHREAKIAIEAAGLKVKS